MQSFPADVQERIRAFLHPWRAMYLASREWTERAAMLWEDHRDPAGFTDPDSDWTFTDPDSDPTVWVSAYSPREEAEDVTSDM